MRMYPLDLKNHRYTVGEILDAGTETLRSRVGASYFRGIIPTVVRAFEVATGLSGDAMRVAAGSHLLLDLHYFARCSGGADPSGDASRAKRFVKELTGDTGTGRRIPATSRITAESLVLVPYFDGRPHELASSASLFLRVVAAARIPLAKIGDFEPLASIAPDLGISSRVFYTAASTYRSARAKLAAVDPKAAAAFGPLARCPSGADNRFGFATLPNLSSWLKRAKYSGPRVGLKEYDYLRILFPVVHQQCEVYREAGTTESGGQASGKQKSILVARITGLAALLLAHAPERYRRDFEAIDFLRIEMPTVDRMQGSTRRLLTAAQREADLGPSMCTLLQYLLDRQSPAMIKTSPARKKIEAAKKLYTPGALAIAQQLNVLLLDQYGREWMAKRPALWAPIAAQYKTCEKLIRRNMLMQGAKPILKNKRKLIETVTYPIIACLILPMLARDCDAAEAEYLAAREIARERGHDNPERHREVAARRAAWYELLFDYAALGVPIEDGKRFAQYCYGQLGTRAQFRPKFEGGRLVELRTVWDRDHHRWSLKDHENKTDKPAEVQRIVSGVLRLDLLEKYMRYARRDALVRRKLVSADYDFMADMCSGSFTFFVSDGTCAQDPTGAWGDRLSLRFGRVLHRCCVEYLGRDLPAFDDLDSEEWFGLFNEHNSRLFAGTYWGGVRGFWPLACELTDDTEDTLRKDYAVVRDAFKAAREPWEVKHVFNRWCDRLLGVTQEGTLEALPERFDPLNEIPANLLPEATVKRLRAMNRRPTKKQQRAAAPRIRRARPDLRGKQPGTAAA